MVTANFSDIKNKRVSDPDSLASHEIIFVPKTQPLRMGPTRVPTYRPHFCFSEDLYIRLHSPLPPLLVSYSWQSRVPRCLSSCLRRFCITLFFLLSSFYADSTFSVVGNFGCPNFVYPQWEVLTVEREMEEAQC